MAIGSITECFVTMKDVISISALKVETKIGLYEWEQQVRQTLIVDLALATDIRKAAHKDDLTHTINYEAVCDQVLELATTKQFKLIETLAERIAALILESFNTSQVTVRVRKVDNMTHTESVGIEITRP